MVFVADVRTLCNSRRLLILRFAFGVLQVEYKELIGGGSEDEVVEVSLRTGCQVVLCCAVLLYSED
jgi:hypothetical protein